MPRIMAPPPSGTEYSVTLEKPFDNKIPEKRIVIYAEPNRDGQITVTERSGSQLENIIEHTGTIDKDDSNELFRLLSTLRGFPSHPDTDIYSLDTRFAFTHDLQWDNGGEESTGEVTDETKQTFKDVVESVQALARQKAKQESRN